ncbi:MAG TPA: hypothetical protein VNL15_04890 [Dehalococcoidia bacterium]|nr:hypothetical protein [Dehalococcoidia bacterium]
MVTPTRFSLSLPQHQARLFYLAVLYHLARPGSEVDPQTMMPYPHGLSELQPLLEAQLNAESAILELTPFQLARIGSSLLGVLNELKLYSLLDTMAGASSRQRSVVSGFDDALRALFPRVSVDSAYASQLAEDVMMLRRELAASIKRAEEALEEERLAAEEARRGQKRWWQFWR